MLCTGITKLYKHAVQKQTLAFADVKYKNNNLMYLQCRCNRMS